MLVFWGPLPASPLCCNQADYNMQKLTPGKLSLISDMQLELDLTVYYSISLFFIFVTVLTTNLKLKLGFLLCGWRPWINKYLSNCVIWWGDCWVSTTHKCSRKSLVKGKRVMPSGEKPENWVPTKRRHRGNYKITSAGSSKSPKVIQLVFPLSPFIHWWSEGQKTLVRSCIETKKTVIFFLGST